MLSRVAENLFWMGRYSERAANTARLLGVNYYLSLDLEQKYVQWEPLVQSTGDYASYKASHDSFDDHAVMNFLVLNPDNANSVVTSIRSARENARIARETLSSEFWEELNRIYQRVETDVRKSKHNIWDTHALCQDVVGSCTRLQGISNDSMWHGEGYYFFQLGLWLERADKTSRFLHAKYFYLLPSVEDVGSPVDDLHWTALLHSMNALDIYHAHYGLVSPHKVVHFLTLDERFPRSMLYCLEKCNYSLGQILSLQDSPDSHINIEKSISELKAFNSKEIIDRGLHEFINDFQTKISTISNMVSLDFF